MVLLLLLAGTAAPPSDRAMPVIATVRISRSVANITEKEWDRQPPAQKREIRGVDEVGRPIVLRVIDYP